MSKLMDGLGNVDGANYKNNDFRSSFNNFNS